MPECPEGKIPTLAPENMEVWSLFHLMMPGLIRRDGYDYTAIEVVLNAHGIEQARRPEMLGKVTRIIDTLEKERRKRNAN